LITGFRLTVRFYYERSGENKRRSTLRAQLKTLFSRQIGHRMHLLIVGAGDGAETIYREIRNHARSKYRVVGFLDDNPAKVGKTIHGVPVLGSPERVAAIAGDTQTDEILIAIPSATSQQMRRIVALCKATGIGFKTIPGYSELIDGKVTLNTIRDVDYRDLLGREVIHLDEEKIGAYLRGQSILITGAGGSIGSELCRQICRYAPGQMLLFDRAESPLYEIDLELRRRYPRLLVIPILGDIQHKIQIERVFARYRPDTVFHAAAYKHVPMLEQQPWKAVENNIGGSLNLVEVAKRHLVERFVFVSTDKAVRPANVMGASKRATEMIIQNQNTCGADTRFMIVRFGNVVGSVGSVVPLFKAQIRQGGPVTVTHPDVTRYFMTIPEACQLILQAGAMGKGGEIFLFDMGTPIRIDDMARDLIRLSGFEPNVDIPIAYIGLRPGEKLHEELVTRGEGIVPSGHEKILVLRGQSCDLDRLTDSIRGLLRLAEAEDAEALRARLKQIVPEYAAAADDDSEVIRRIDRN
jgi:FlaA1/EpsC-like NDP-sugar epimerase